MNKENVLYICTMEYHLAMRKKEMQITEPSYTVGGNVIGAATMKNSMEVLQKTKNRTGI